jgi:hypothetical protein
MALSAANTKTSILALLDDNAELLSLLASITASAAVGANLPVIQQIMPTILAKGRAVAGAGSLSYAEAEQQYKEAKNKNNPIVVERYLSPQDAAFDDINSIAGLDAFTALVCNAAAKADGALVKANQIKEQCMSHLQTFIYPLRISYYTAIGNAAFPSTLTYGPATSSVSTNPATTFSATPTPSMVSRTTSINYKSMFQYPPNCLYQSQLKMKDGYTEGTTYALAFAMGGAGSDITGNCLIKTFVKNGVIAPQKEFPFDTDNFGVTDSFSTFSGLYMIYIRRSDSMVIFVDKASGNPPKRAFKTIPPNIVIKLRNTGRRAADECNNVIGNYVGSMCLNNMKVVTIQDDEENKVAVVDAVYPTRTLSLPAQPAAYFVGDYDVRTINIGNPLTPEDLATLRFLARVAFWRYRVLKPASYGGSNRMMITNGKNRRTKNRNMNKKQRRSKSKSKSMSMFKSAKRAFYRTNKRNKTSRHYY